MTDSPITALFNTNGYEIPVLAGVAIGATESGFIGVGVDSSGVARFLSVSAGGVLNVAMSGVATETTLSGLSGKFGSLGQKDMAGSAPVVIASDQSAVPVSCASLPLTSGEATGNTLSALNGKVGTGVKVSASSTSVVLASDALYLPVRVYEPATFTALIAGVSITANASLASIVNTGSKVIRIQEVYVSNVVFSPQVGVVGAFMIRRITGHSSGSAVSLIETMDSADALDSGITVRTGATVSGQSSSVLKRALFNTSSWDKVLTTTSLNHSMEIYFPLFTKTEGGKAIVLRANEGMTLNFESSGSSGTYDIHVIFTQE